MNRELTLELGDDMKIVTTHDRAARALARELAFEPGQILRNLAPLQVFNGVAGAPAIGQLWPGQGGYNGGLYPARGGVPAHYLIVSDLKDEPSLAYGGYDKKIDGADDKDDGLKNCQVLIASGHQHPAAKFCMDYEEDGHNDYFLMARRQGSFLAATVPQLFKPDLWYWTSTRFSRDDAIVQDFAGGDQNGYDLHIEYPVRPVRRFFLTT